MEESPINRKEAKKLLCKIAPNYKNLMGFEKFVDNYNGENKKYLLRVVHYIQKKNSRGDTRILGLGDSEIEQILNAIIPPTAF